MYNKDWEELKKNSPLKEGEWDKEVLYEYLVWSCHKDFHKLLDHFFSKYQKDEKLAELLFDFLLDEEYDGSDCQIGAAYYIARLDKKY